MNAVPGIPQLLVFDTNNRLVSASQTGAQAFQTTTYCGSATTCNNATFGNDMAADMYSNVAAQTFVNTGCNSSNSDFWQVTFASGPAYPGGFPAEISNIYFVNRLGGYQFRITIPSAAQIQLYSTTGDMVGVANITSSSTVSMFSFNPPVAAPLPDLASAFQTSATARLLTTRFVHIDAAAGKCLTFREIFVFDLTYTNVALLKTTRSSTLSTGSTSQMGVDGVIDYDNVSPGNLLSSSACDGSAWWEVDLGALYEIAAIMIWNYEPQSLCSSNSCAAAQALAGASLSLLNFAGDGVINVTKLNGNGIETIFAPILYAPTISLTSTMTNTPSPSASISYGETPSHTNTQTASPSETPSNSATATPSLTPLSYLPVSARISTTGVGQCLNFVEVSRHIALQHFICCFVLCCTRHAINWCFT